ncbi:hypothetical protein K5I04_05060 [Murdochiella sp. Marseille-P8839]|nr:hypothetical protein [Murdochiella sp. Marseille-P8839]
MNTAIVIDMTIGSAKGDLTVVKTLQGTAICITIAENAEHVKMEIFVKTI